MKRVAILLLLCAVWAVGLMAQEIVTGTVVDGKNEPVPGVRVEIDGRSEYAMTDIDGTFRIELPVTAKKVRVTYPGFKPIERKITPDMVIKLGHGWGARSSGYRGFFDINGGFGFGGKVNVAAGQCRINDIKRGLVFGWSTTHGYQVNRNLFLGLGVGIYAQSLVADCLYDGMFDTEYEFESFSIPLYLDARWDFGLAEKTAPYVRVKVGYQQTLAVEGDDYDYYDYLESYEDGRSLGTCTKSMGSFFLQPEIGMRVRIGGRAGMNFGLAYNMMSPFKLAVGYGESYWGSPDWVEELSPSRSGVLMLNIGFDF